MIFRNVHDMVLDDIFVELDGFVAGSQLLVKIEGLNAAGSIKIKPAVEAVRDAEAQGLLRPGGRIIESSSGNLGIALSMVCAARNYQLTIVTDRMATRAAIHAMRALGTDVVIIDKVDANGGYLQNRIEYIERALARDPTLLWLNQYANPANVRAHRTRTARSIHEHLGSVDVLVVGTGTAGTLMGCVEYQQEHGFPERIVAVDAEGSVTFGGPAGCRRIPGLGSSRRSDIFRDTGTFDKVTISELETVAACRMVARRYGLLVGGSTGTALAAARRLGGSLRPRSRVVVISPDLGDKYLDTVYSDDWVRQCLADGSGVLLHHSLMPAVSGSAS